MRQDQVLHNIILEVVAEVRLELEVLVESVVAELVDNIQAHKLRQELLTLVVAVVLVRVILVQEMEKMVDLV
ncbi:MAG: hypothetical protein CMJ17_14290 [Phenylobacterium sp.]|nr:hypothetical protein [Phenylobacterium sp.]